MSEDPLWDDSRLTPSAYPGWMPPEVGAQYRDRTADDFRTAMSALAATVCVVAAAGPSGERTGMTATAVCSLSTDPPQLVACVNRSSSLARALDDTGWFSVNILAADQEDVAGAFAGRTGLTADARFTTGSWTTHATGAPVLEQASATCICHAATAVRQATHLIVVGAVLDVRLERSEPAPPLLYHMRRFAEIHPAEASARRTSSPGGTA